MILSARQRKLRVVFSEGTSETILRASSLLMEEGIATPVLLGRESEVREAIERLRLGLSGAQIVEPARSPRFESYVDEYFRMRRRRGIMRAAAAQRVRQTDTFAALMLHLSDADMMIAGVSTHYVESLRTILEVIGPAPGVRRVSSHYLVLLPRGRSSSPTAPSTWTPTPRSWPRSLCLRPPRRGPSASSPASPCSPSPTSGAWTTPTRGRSGGPRRSRRRRPPASSSTARCS
jgi:malate dehydrogenase (oxaloacetate-decarboxylating)(NADP+)